MIGPQGKRGKKLPWLTGLQVFIPISVCAAIPYDGTCISRLWKKRFFCHPEQSEESITR
jgi:hypothetical protein